MAAIRSVNIREWKIIIKKMTKANFLQTATLDASKLNCPCILYEPSELSELLLNLTLHFHVRSL